MSGPQITFMVLLLILLVSLLWLLLGPSKYLTEAWNEAGRIDPQDPTRQFWREAVIWMALGGACTPIVFFAIERDIGTALSGVPVGLLASLLCHLWVWRTGGPGDPRWRRR